MAQYSPPGIPRPRGRGLIEAVNFTTPSHAGAQFHDRAVVASLKPTGNAYWDEAGKEFHDRAVVASLKQAVQADDICDDHNSTTARSWPH